MDETSWTGAWVAERLGVEVTTSGSPAGRDVPSLVGLALRRNPRRAHLLVSDVLGKHVPVDPRHALAVAGELGELVAPLLADPAGALVIGYAETATALGHEVARTLGAPYLHSTRRPADGPELLTFEEAHSHATSHRLLPRDPHLLDAASAVVLVDDELSTGATALATIRALHAVRPPEDPIEQYVVAALIDLRDDTDRTRTVDLAAELGARIDVVSLASGRVELGADLTARATELLDSLPAAPTHPPAGGRVVRVDVGWPGDVPTGGRHGFPATDEAGFSAAVDHAAARLLPHLAGRWVHVLGTEELMYVPQRIGAALAEQLPDVVVTTSSTTRSPVAVVDDPAYAVRSALVFGSHDAPLDGPGERYAYNLTGRDLTTVVVVVDTAADTPALVGLLDRLSEVTPQVVVVSVP